MERFNRRFTLVGKMAKLAKVFKAAKLLKPILTIGSMGASVLIYSFGLGIWFAIGFVMMLFIHEMGHVVALKKKGLPASAPVFIPMLGAVIFAPNMGSRHDEAYMGYAGPLIGGGAAAVLLGAIAIDGTPPRVVALVCWVALYLNLFNLIPIRPLDGGRVTQAVGPWFRYVGVAMLLALTLALREPGLLLIWILVLGDFKIRRQTRAAFGWFIQALMMVMEIGQMGAAHYPLGLIILDAALATFINLSYSFLSNEELEAIDDRPHVPKHHKLRWLGAYVSLAAVLTGLMVVAHSYIPADALGK